MHTISHVYTHLQVPKYKHTDTETHTLHVCLYINIYIYGGVTHGSLDAIKQSNQTVSYPRVEFTIFYKGTKQTHKLELTSQIAYQRRKLLRLDCNWHRIKLFPLKSMLNCVAAISDSPNKDAESVCDILMAEAKYVRTLLQFLIKIGLENNTSSIYSGEVKLYLVKVHHN